MARPGLALALSEAEVKPDHLYTVFAGNDAEVAAQVRSYFHGYPPSSPSMGILKDGKLVAMIQRHDIEGHSAQQVAEEMIGAFNSHCK